MTSSGTGIRITDEDIETICSLRREGMTIPEISENVGRSEITVRKYLFKNGLSVREAKNKTTPLTVFQYDHVKIIQLSGKTSAEVAMETGLPLAEINGAYGSSKYIYYMQHR